MWQIPDSSRPKQVTFSNPVEPRSIAHHSSLHRRSGEGIKQLFGAMPTKLPNPSLFSDTIDRIAGTGLDSSSTRSVNSHLPTLVQKSARRATQHENRCCCSYYRHCSRCDWHSDSSSDCCSTNRRAAVGNACPSF